MKSMKGACALCLVAILALPAGALGQVEFPEEEDEEEVREGWRGSVDLGFTTTEGNAETSSLSTGAEVIHRMDPHRWTFTGSLHRASAEGEETANRGSLAGQYDFFAAEDVFLFGRGRAGYNRPAGISRRLTYGAGAGYALADTDQVTLTSQLGATFISERLADGETSTELHALLAERLSVEVTDVTQIVQSLEYQPRFADLGDFLAQGELALITRLLGALGLRVALSGEYDSSPFVDEDGIARERLDLTFTTGLTYEF
jgi:putative salt-induced outer membrane protein YdiY